MPVVNETKYTINQDNNNKNTAYAFTDRPPRIVKN